MGEALLMVLGALLLVLWTAAGAAAFMHLVYDYGPDRLKNRFLLCLCCGVVAWCLGLAACFVALGKRFFVKGEDDDGPSR